MTGRRQVLFAATVLGGLALGAVGLAVGAGQPGYQRAASYTEGFREPAAVQALPDGAVAVADFSADAVTVLEPGGKRRWTVDRGLDHPSGLGLDDQGLWVADTGHHRVLLLDPATGRQQQVVQMDPGYQPTDVAPRSDGALWISATPQDHLLLVQPSGEVLLDLDRVKDGPLQAPRGLLADGQNGVYVAEALGGRVLHLDAAGVLVEALGSWGLGEGQFLKPKDVARGADGDLLVLDSHQAIVQVLDQQGQFRRLVASASGAIEFQHPLGLAVAGGDVFVADAGASAVQVYRRGGDLFAGGHFPSPEVLFRSTSIRDEDPSPLCRQCHDGTRRLTAGNWDPKAHNHPLKVGDGADVPAEVRRTNNGDLECFSCHAIHVRRDTTEHSDMVDVGVPEAPTHDKVQDPDFCLECHADHLDPSPARHRKSHPVGLLPPPGAKIAALQAAGAVFDQGRVTCRTCHRPHGARYDHLLVRPADQGDLCLSCHTDHGKDQSHHPVLMKVDEQMRSKVLALGGVIGADGTLTCLSCHDPHQSTAATLLRTTGSGTTACKACHETQAVPLAQGGHARVDCEFCHGMHEPAAVAPGAHRAGVGPQACVDCHTNGSEAPQIQLAAMHPIGVAVKGAHGNLPLLDGKIGCDTCHEPHGANEYLLRAKSVANTCLDCHPEKATVTDTNHDASVVPVAGSDQTCISCHHVHGAKGRYMLPITNHDVNPASGRCLRCHDGSTSAKNPGFTTHPTGLLLTATGLPFRYAGPVPYYGPDGERTTKGEAGEITCLTCHDPHTWKHDEDLHPGAGEGNEQNSFLRNPDDVAHFCTVCHGIDGRAYFRFFHTDQFRKDEPRGGTP